MSAENENNRKTEATEMGRVSVIIPCYCQAQFLREAVDSALAQTYPNVEVIVVNDGSDDNTEEVAKSYGDRIRYVWRENGGLSAARNTGLDHARGEYVVFLDADDLLIPEMVAQLVGAIQASHGTGAAYCGVIRSDPDLLDRSWGVPPYLGASLFETLAQWNPFACHSVLVKRDIVDAAGRFDTSLRACEDWDLWQRIARTGVRFVAVQEQLVVYRMNPVSMSRDPLHFFGTGRTVILRGHGVDPRVTHPSPSSALGRRGSPQDALRSWAILCACLAVAKHNEDVATCLLARACVEGGGNLQPEHLADCRSILLFGLALPPSRCEELWPKLGTILLQTLLRVDAHMASPGFAVEALLYASGLKGEHERLNGEHERLKREHERLNGEHERLKGDVGQFQEQFDSICRSRTWKLATRAFVMRDWLLGRRMKGE